MVETGTFPNGITNDKGEICREYILAERTFRCSLELANDPALKKELLVDPTYYDAAIISKRLKVAGIEHLTPEMVLDLEGDDADQLAHTLMALDKRRADFRSGQQAAPKADDSAAQAGGAVGGSSGDAAGGGGQPAVELPGDRRPAADQTKGKEEESLT